LYNLDAGGDAEHKRSAASALYTTMRTSFNVKRSKVKVTRPITAETESVSYLRDAKAYELQNCYADGACYQLPRPAIKA